MLNVAHGLQNRLLSLIGQAKYQLLERRFSLMFRIGLVATTLLLVIVANALLSERPMLGLAVVGGVGALVVLVFVYNYLELSLFLLMLTTTVLNPPLPRDVTTTLIVLLLLNGVWLFKLIVVQRSFKSLRPVLPNYTVPLFVTATLISFVWSNNYVDLPVKYLQDGKILPRVVTLLVLVLSPLTMLLVGNLLRSLQQLKRMFYYFIIFGSVGMLIWLIGSIRIPILNLNGQIALWTSLFAMGQALFNTRLPMRVRIGLGVVVAGWGYVQIGLGMSWLSGWVPLVLGLVIVSLLWSRAVLVFIIILGVIFVAVQFEDFQRILLEENQESGGTRLEAGGTALAITGEHYLFGTGPAGYYFYMTTYTPGLFQLSHNNFIDILAQTGVVGFVTWLLLWASIGWTVLRTYLRVPRKGFAGGLAASLVAVYVMSLLLMMLGDWITPFTYTQTMRGLSYTIWPWMWAGIAIALPYLADDQDEATVYEAA